MWHIAQTASEIRECHRRLEALLIGAATDRVNTQAGTQAGRIDVEAYWIDPLRIWFASRRVPNAPRRYYWNAFGIQQPSGAKSMDIICEINFPRRGIHRNVGAAFAVDEGGGWHIVHRGTIGGGRSGIGKTLFFENWRGEQVVVKDGERETKVALVGDLNSPRLVDHIGVFVHDVARVKRSANGSQFKNALSRHPRFTMEPEKRRAYEAQGWRQPSADHGLIVNYLARRFQRVGKRIGSDQRDLFILDRAGNVRIVFEVETSAGNVYEGLGQLFVYSVRERVRPILALVSPHLPKSLTEAIKTLGVSTLWYEFQGKQPKVVGLDRLLAM